MRKYKSLKDIKTENKLNQLVNEKTLDLGYLKEILGDNDKDLAEVLTTLYRELPAQVEDLVRSSSHKNWKQAGEDAHKMRSSIMIIGMPDLLLRIGSIEKQGKEGTDLSMLPNLIEQTISGISLAISLIKMELDKIQAALSHH